MATNHPDVLPAGLEQDVEAGIRAWREKVLQVLLLLGSALLFLPLLAVWVGWGVALAPFQRGLFTSVYVLLLATTLLQRGPYALRAGVLLALVGLMGLLRLLIGRLEGSGRITLILLPLLALLLAGPRIAWMLVVVVVIQYLGALFLLHSRWLASWGPTWMVDPSPLSFWALQGVFGLIVLLTLMILFTRFHALLYDAMRAESQARRQWIAETAERHRLETAIVRIDEEERRRLGAELHDGLCQHLTAALLTCSALETQWARNGLAEPTALGPLRDSLAECVGLAYDVAKDLCPIDIGPEGLLPALEHLCRETRERSRILCSVQAHHEWAIQDPAVSMHLYRIAREAVANAVKHAACTRIDLALEAAGPDLVLHISDDGPDVAPGISPPFGLGLRILQHRARLIGATLQVAGGPHGGMHVVCRMKKPESVA